MDMIDPTVANVDGEITGEVLQWVYNRNPELHHTSDTARYLVCVLELPRPRFFKWLVPARFMVSIHRTAVSQLNMVSNEAVDTRIRGGVCYLARASELATGAFPLESFWQAYSVFLEDLATRNATLAVKELAGVTMKMVNTLLPEPT